MLFAARRLALALALAPVALALATAQARFAQLAPRYVGQALMHAAKVCDRIDHFEGTLYGLRRLHVRGAG